MKEIEVRINFTGEREILFGITLEDALRRYNTIDKVKPEGNWFKHYTVPNPNSLHLGDFEVIGIWDEVE